MYFGMLFGTIEVRYNGLDIFSIYTILGRGSLDSKRFSISFTVEYRCSRSDN